MPSKHHPEIYALPKVTISREPSVQYRGIFINDEAPALTGWVRDKFGGYNVQFYEKVFELLLRLKANFLWPAMWPGWPNPGASFFTDDPLNQSTADTWGIVISTSHHEPMQRLSNEWLAENPLGTWDWVTNKAKITDFFATGVKRAKGYESYFTMGMRGEYDTKMQTDDPAAVVEDVLMTQRGLIKEVYGLEDAVPQLLVLYKEVQKQYESGRLQVPDDITLMFSDDNFGTIRRLPCGSEGDRTGGAGLYYHLEYVGTPRSYKWINSNSLRRILHQLREAYRRLARRVWVFNVGDIKPLEVPLTFALALAWDIEYWEPFECELAVRLFLCNLAGREFGLEFSSDVGRAWAWYDNLVSLRRHEHIEPTTFSLLHYQEADRVLEEWQALKELAQSIYDRASEAMKPAIFQLVLHPILASENFVSLQINLGRNRLYARQRRNSANHFADLVRTRFFGDFEITEMYHALLHGKWNHILAQPHFGFDDNTWHAPSRDMISGLSYVQTRQNSNPIVGQMGIAVEGHVGVRPGLINENSDFTHPSRGDLVPGLTLGPMTYYGPKQRWFEIFTRGTLTVRWNIMVPYKWLQLSQTNGVLEPGELDQRVYIQIAWHEVDANFQKVVPIDIRSDNGDFEQVHLPVLGRRAPPGTTGFIEGDGLITIETTPPLASEYASNADFQDTLQFIKEEAPSIHTANLFSQEVTLQYDYDIFMFSDLSQPGTRARLLLYFNMTLDTDPSHPMSYQLRVNQGPTISYNLLEEDSGEGDPELPSPQGWLKAVQDCVWIKEHSLLPHRLSPGEHTLRVRLLHANMVLKKIVLDFGGLKDSYLGPPYADYAMVHVEPEVKEEPDVEIKEEED